MEQRALRAQQIDQEQKQKLENKEEKSANIKNKMLAENQEKAEKYVKMCYALLLFHLFFTPCAYFCCCRVRAALLYRQQEAEQRRKAEELEKHRLWVSQFVLYWF